MQKILAVLAFSIMLISITLLAGCINPPVCGNGVCEIGEDVSGSPNYCPADCGTTPETHTECQQQACVTVQGAGTSECKTDLDCQALKPIQSVMPRSIAVLLSMALAQTSVSET